MSTNTQVIWNWPVDPATTQAIEDLHVQYAQYETQPLETVLNSPMPGQSTVTRYWVDSTRAQEWIDVMLPLNPVSAIILP